MVGYNEADALSSEEKMVAGAVSGVVTRFVTQPLEVIKLRVQLLQKSKKGGVRSDTTVRTVKKPAIMKIAQHILRKEGLTAFWYGHTLGQVHSIVAVGCQFHFFELTTKFLSQNASNFYAHQRKTCNFLCGLFAGCASAAMVSPIEVIRVRQMVGRKNKGVWLDIKRVYNNGGILGFYKGLSASVLQTGPNAGLMFVTFTTLQPIIIRHLSDCDHGGLCKDGVPEKGKVIMTASSISASIAGLVAKTLTYPLDLAKRRLQMAAHATKSSGAMKVITCRSLFRCLAQSLIKGGVSGLYRGLLITLIRAQVTSLVAFNTYELMILAFRNKAFLLNDIVVDDDADDEDETTPSSKETPKKESGF